jgi:hypothetical protein
MQNNDSKNAEARIAGNPHFARVLRQRLENRHPQQGAVRETLSRMNDQELITAYLNNERLGREHTAKRRAENSGA